MYIEIRVQWTINLGSSHMHAMVCLLPAQQAFPQTPPPTITATDIKTGMRHIIIIIIIIIFI